MLETLQLNCLHEVMLLLYQVRCTHMHTERTRNVRKILQNDIYVQYLMSGLKKTITDKQSDKDSSSEKEEEAEYESALVAGGVGGSG